MATDRTPIDKQGGRSELKRDSQQWVLDYLIQETGKVQHFQGGRGDLPRSVRSHAMISKHVARQAISLEEFADSELSMGHRYTALSAYFQATMQYGHAQHPIFERNAEKTFLYERLRRCYDRVIELAPYRIEHLQIEWEGTLVSGHLHLAPGDEPKPLIFYIPGCDAVKESYPHPLFNYAHQRGAHLFSFEGPGGAECVARGVELTADNHQRAASAALDVLVARPEIDADRVMVLSNSFGTYWGLRFAATDTRVRAVAAVQASICEKYIQTDLESPRWKQLFAFLTNAPDERRLDQIMAEMSMRDYFPRITCPTLITVGEFDPRAPLDEVLELFDSLGGSGELWILEDQHHGASVGDPPSGLPEWASAKDGVMADWLLDHVIGGTDQLGTHEHKVLFVSGKGPHHESARGQRNWFAAEMDQTGAR